MRFYPNSQIRAIAALAALSFLPACIETPASKAPPPKEEPNHVIHGTVSFLLDLIERPAMALTFGPLILIPPPAPSATDRFTLADLIQAHVVNRLSTYHDPIGLEDLSNERYCSNLVCQTGDVCAHLFLVPSQAKAETLNVYRIPYQVCETSVVNNSFEFNFKKSRFVKDLLKSSMLRVEIDDPSVGSAKISDFSVVGSQSEATVNVDAATTFTSLAEPDLLYKNASKELQQEINEITGDTRDFTLGSAFGRNEIKQALLAAGALDADIPDIQSSTFATDAFTSSALAPKLAQILEGVVQRRMAIEQISDAKSDLLDDFVGGLSGKQFLDRFGGASEVRQSMLARNPSNFLELANRSQQLLHAKTRVESRDPATAPSLMRHDFPECVVGTLVQRLACASATAAVINQDATDGDGVLPANLTLDRYTTFADFPAVGP